MGRILFFIAAFIVYVSLYPFELQSRPSLGGILAAWPARLDRFVIRDVGLNVLLYLPLGWFALTALARNMRKWGAFAGAVELGAVLSCCIEIVQYFEPTRFSSSLDLICNTAGAAFGAVLALMYGEWLTRVTARPRVALSAPVLLLPFWFTYLVYPPMPVLSRTRLLQRIETLFSPGSLSPLDAVTGTVDWLVAAALIEAAGFKRPRVLLLALMALVPGRLLLAGRVPTSSDVIAAAAACGIWTVFRLHPKRMPVLAALCVAAIVVRGLEPFRFTGTPNAFSWLPLAGSLGAERGPAFAVLVRKVFTYGSALWLLRQLRWRSNTSAAALAALLAAIEAVQIYLPGRTPEITDPLLALLIAIALKRIELRGTAHALATSAHQC